MAADALIPPGQEQAGLDEREREHFVRAVAAAIDVRQRDHFLAWMRGPFHDLLPHENAACLRLDDSGEITMVECLSQQLVEAVAQAFLCHPVHGLAVQLARALHGKPGSLHVLDERKLRDRLAALACDVPREVMPPRNAVIYQTRLFSGANFCLVIFNLAEPALLRSHELLRLLSSHLKMALAGAVSAGPQARSAPRSSPLTDRELDILRCMREGLSNREISQALGFNPITLKNHISKIYRKLDVQNRAQAVSRLESLRIAG